MCAVCDAGVHSLTELPALLQERHQRTGEPGCHAGPVRALRVLWAADRQHATGKHKLSAGRFAPVLPVPCRERLPWGLSGKGSHGCCRSTAAEGYPDSADTAQSGVASLTLTVALFFCGQDCLFSDALALLRTYTSQPLCCVQDYQEQQFHGAQRREGQKVLTDRLERLIAHEDPYNGETVVRIISKGFDNLSDGNSPDDWKI